MSETEYILRYEKGNFQSGYCILNESKVAVVNKFFALEGKVNSLIEIIRSIKVDSSKLSDNNKKLYSEITNNQLQL
jgi:predicted nuclease with TOPRIM domain